MLRPLPYAVLSAPVRNNLVRQQYNLSPPTPFATTEGVIGLYSHAILRPRHLLEPPMLTLTKRPAAKRLLAAPLAFLLALVCLLTFTAPARAQVGGLFGPTGSFEGGITRKGVNAYTKILSLDETQKEAALDLMKGNRAALKELQKEMEAKSNSLQEKMRESGDMQAMMKEMPNIAKEAMSKARTIEKSFFDDLKALLTPEQEAKFPLVEYHRRRETWLRVGIRSGQGVDLVEALDKNKIDPKSNPELNEAVNTYIENVDKLLKPVEGMLEEAMTKMFEKMGKGDFMTMADAFVPMDEQAKKIRDLNRDSARKILPLLKEKDRAAVDLEIKRRSFPRVYKESNPERALAAAMNFEDATKDQKESIKTLQDSYKRDAEVANDKWAAALEEKEEKKGGKIKMTMSMWQDQGGGEDDAAKAKKVREELDTATMDKLKAILKEDQRSKLPADKKDSFNPMEDLMPGFEKEEGDN